ncbi:hypothetical protein CR513_42325, partial [Mucuna pruriens]
MGEQLHEAHQRNKGHNASRIKKKKPFIKKKKKSLMATWEDLDLSSSKDEDEEANICLMEDTPYDDNDDDECVLNTYDKRRVYVLRSPSKERKLGYLRRIGKHPFSSIDNVLFVKGLKHNLMSIRQLYESGYDVSFNKGECIVKDYKDRQIRGSFEFKNIVSTSRYLELLHIDFFFWPIRTSQLGGKHYGLMTTLHGYRLCYLRTRMSLLRSSLYYTNVFKMKKEEAINTTSYLRNKIYIRPILEKTPYELWKVCKSRTLKVKESIHVKFNDCKPDKELLELNDSLAYLNLGDLKTPSKEHCLDNEPKVDKVAIS